MSNQKNSILKLTKKEIEFKGKVEEFIKLKLEITEKQKAIKILDEEIKKTEYAEISAMGYQITITEKLTPATFQLKLFKEDNPKLDWENKKYYAEQKISKAITMKELK